MCHNSLIGKRYTSPDMYIVVMNQFQVGCKTMILQIKKFTIYAK